MASHTQFPSSICMNKDLDYTSIEKANTSREDLFNQLSKYSNDNLYEFLADKKITFDTDNYKFLM